MKKVGFFLAVLIMFFDINNVWALPAFPGAEGFGAQSIGGRGGVVYEVTNLNDNGPGSLRAAVEANEPRVVIFRLSGNIELQSELLIENPYITIAGQTAPGDGICLKNYNLRISADHVIVRYLRIRPGDNQGAILDGVSISQGRDIIVDHCSVSWAVDENPSVSGPQHQGRSGTSHNVTFSHCIIAEALHDSSHGEGPHSKGSLIHDDCTEIAIVGNIYAHNDDRNPYFKADVTGVVVNNLIYNPATRAMSTNYVAGEYRGQAERPRLARVTVGATY